MSNLRTSRFSFFGLIVVISVPCVCRTLMAAGVDAEDPVSVAPKVRKTLQPPELPPVPPMPAEMTEAQRKAREALRKSRSIVPRLAGQVTTQAVTPPQYNVTLAWDPSVSTNGVGIGGYNLYFSNQNVLRPGVPPAIPIDVGNVTQYQVQGINPTNAYFFVATAYDTSGL